jgi:hypothetical protein
MKIPAAFLLLILSLTCFGANAEALPDCTVANINTISMSGAPSLQMTNAGAMVGVTYASNAQGCDYPGIVFLVAHNTMPQTVYISTATVLLTPNQNVTAYPFVFGFPPGTPLNSTIFVVSSSGVALSSATIFVFTTF